MFYFINIIVYIIKIIYKLIINEQRKFNTRFQNNPLIYKIIQRVMSGKSLGKFFKENIKKNLRILDIGCAS